MQDIDTTSQQSLNHDMSPYLGSKYQSPITSRSPSPSLMEQTVEESKYVSDDEISVGCPSPALQTSPNYLRSREPSPGYRTVKPSSCRCPDQDIEDYFTPLKKLKMVETDRRISPTVEIEERQDGVKSFSIIDILNHKPSKPQCTRIVRPWDIDTAEADAHQQRLELVHRQLKVQQQLALLRPDFVAFNASYTSETGSDRSSSVASDCCSPDIITSSGHRQRQQQQQGKQTGGPGSTPLDALFQMTSKTFDSSAGESSADLPCITFHCSAHGRRSGFFLNIRFCHCTPMMERRELTRKLQDLLVPAEEYIKDPDLLSEDIKLLISVEC